MQQSFLMSTAKQYGAELFEALREGSTVAPLIERDASLTIDDSYAISLDFLARRRAEGERVVGKKIGVTSKAVQDRLGVHQPDFGFLTDWMHVEGDINVADKKLIQPRAEAVIAFFLGEGL
jgi:2-oxopent-4-enoate/cis-2-oxohex-4-enoate hydratase